MKSSALSLLFAAVVFPDLPVPTRLLLEHMGISAASFPSYLQEVERRTAARERDGENDHLIFYVLQSRQFTGEPPLEPALSAREFQEGQAVPPAVGRRFRAFLQARLAGERLEYLRGLVPATAAMAYLDREYARAMRSLYAKEFANSGSFYRERGHSTDTQVPANYAVWEALSVLRATEPALRLDRVLVVGPGLDFAPRTGFDERFPPQSYQPYAVADALLKLGLSAGPSIHCVDINERVLRFFHDFPLRRDPTLHLFTPPGNADYAAYFRSLGSSLGESHNVSGFEKTIHLRAPVAGTVTAERLNIVTARLDRTFDLVIATNVMIYFDGAELLLSLANMQAMLTPGGILIHNDLRPVVDEYAAAAGLSAMQARTIQLGRGAKAPLYDAFAIYRRASR